MIRAPQLILTSDINAEAKSPPKLHALYTVQYTAISRKVVGKNVHATIRKGNMGYDRYTVPNDCSYQTYFCCFPLALANTFSWPFEPILSKSSEEQ